ASQPRRCAARPATHRDVETVLLPGLGAQWTLFGEEPCRLEADDVLAGHELDVVRLTAGRNIDTRRAWSIKDNRGRQRPTILVDDLDVGDGYRGRRRREHDIQPGGLVRDDTHAS